MAFALLCAALALAGRLPAAAQQEGAAEEEILGSASGLKIEGHEERTVPLEAGTKLHEEPHGHAPVVTVIDVDLSLAPLERRGGWVRVQFGGRVGWADLGEAPTVSAPEPVPSPELPVAGPPAELAADEERLARALSFLDPGFESIEAGSLRLYTDVKSDRKRRTLAGAAGQLTGAYQERYGLAPERRARFAVVVFAREKAYREFEDSLTELEQLDAQGHAGSGVAALVGEDRTPAEAAALLIHELAHLLNRRTFRASLPPWLEEGIANDLAYCRLDRSGRPLPRTLGGRGFIAEVPGPADQFGRRGFSGTVHIEGPIASLGRLKQKIVAGDSVPLPELLDLTWREFVAPEGRELRYVQSTFLIRYLLDGLDGASFKRFLAAFQAGGAADAPTLLAALGLDVDELSAGFEEWIRRHSGRP